VTTFTIEDELDVLSLLEPDGGFTYPPPPLSGYMVSLSRANGGVTDVFELSELNPGRIADHRMKASTWLEHSDVYIGGWHDPDTHLIYLDISRCHQTREEAEAYALLNDQMSIFDLSTFDSIPTGGTGQS